MSNVIFQPHPGKQTLIFTTSCDEILAGGAKKTGKTQVAIARPLVHVHDERFRCVIIRRTIPGLKYIEGQARRLYRKVCPEVDHNKTQHTFTFPSGAQIALTFAESLEDCERLEGFAYQMLIVDEARQFPDPLLIDTLAAELYAENDPATGRPWMHPRLLLLSNPGGKGGQWLRERFAIDKFPRGGQEIYDPETKRYRLYIHMTIKDNPSMEADSYIAGLRRYPLWKQKQMIDGDWHQREGSAFEEFDANIHVIPSFEVGKGWEVHRSCDWGYSTYCAIHYWAVHEDYNATVCVDELTFSRTKPRDVARACLRLEEKRGYDVAQSVMDPSAWGDDTSGLSPAATMADEGVFFRRAINSREDGYRAMVTRLSTMIELHDGSLIPSIRFVEDRCPRLWQSLPQLPQKVGEDDVEKAETKKADGGKGGDHWYDSCFVAGTMVDTGAGPVPIERVADSALVLSADGSLHMAVHPRLTRRMAPTVTVKMVDGRSVRCTPDHRFATESGWVEAQHLAGRSVLDLSESGGHEEAVIEVLHAELQNAEPMGATWQAEEGLDIPVSAIAAEVASVVPSQPADVYCLTVPDTGCFSVCGGLIVSNCRYHVMSLPLPERQLQSVERFRGVPGDYDNEREKVSPHQGMRGF